jgi:Tfp pilus assembly protein PilO
MKTKNLAVGALAAALTLALWWNFLLKPTQKQASKVKAETTMERTKLQPLEAQVAQAQADAAHASTFKAQLAVLQHAVPDSPALADFIRDANAIADASRISWQSVTHGPPTPGTAGVASITVGIQIRGTYEQVRDYLGRIAALSRLLVLDNVQFAAVGATTTTPGGAAAGPASSTGPFVGGTELTVTITARMFETPAGLAEAPGAYAGAVTTAASTG